MMHPEIKTLAPKQLIGMRLKMSLATDRTQELWQGFMPRRQEVPHRVSEDYFSLQVFNPAPGAEGLQPTAMFEKWAAVEVSDAGAVPAGMEAFLLPAGLYAVFLHKGGPPRAAETFGYIYRTWLPASGYALDDRPHFEVLGVKYRHGDPASEEEIWIPVRRKL